jgi:hypothetical protein
MAFASADDQDAKRKLSEHEQKRRKTVLTHESLRKEQAENISRLETTIEANNGAETIRSTVTNRPRPF